MAHNGYGIADWECIISGPFTEWGNSLYRDVLNLFDKLNVDKSVINEPFFKFENRKFFETSKSGNQRSAKEFLTTFYWF